MPTWGELRERVFARMELPRETTGDLKDTVEEALIDVYRDMITDLNPRELFTTAGPVEIEDEATSLSIATDFSVTNLREIFSVNVNTTPEDTEAEPRPWLEMSWEDWISQEGSRPGNRWTLSPANELHFSTAPGADITWEVTLHYYKTIAAFDEEEEPEISEDYHHVIALGAACEFPSYFSARQEMFAKLQSRFNNGVERFRREARYSVSLRTMKSRSRRYDPTRIRWE